jgi:hypothetical protein
VDSGGGEAVGFARVRQWEEVGIGGCWLLGHLED